MITNEQREQRRAYLGSSDIAALCNLDPFKNAYDVWLDKTGKLEGDGKSSEAADVGTFLESGIISLLERRMNISCERNISLERHEGFPACANLDGAIIAPYRDGTWLRLNPNFTTSINIEAVVEAKSTSRQDEWGERAGDVPLRVICQTNWQMWIADCQRAFVPVLFPDFGRFRFEVYPVERNDQLIEELVYRAGQFWHNNVLKDTPPGNVVPHLETLKRMRRVPSTVVELGERAVELQSQLAVAKEARRELEQSIEQIQTEILTMMGDAEGGTLPDGSQFTYLEQGGNYSCDFTLLRERLRQIGQEQIYTELVKQSRFRVLRHRKASAR